MPARIRYLALLFLLLILPSAACADELTLESFGPIDLQKHMQQMTSAWGKNKVSTGTNRTMANSSRAANMFATIMTNDWLITRSLMYGFSNFSGAVNTLNSHKSSVKQDMFEIDNAAVDLASGKTNRVKNIVDSRSRSRSSAKPHQKSRTDLRYAQYEVMINNIQDMTTIKGYQVGSSVYMRVSYLSLMVLCLTFLIHLSQVMYKQITGRGENSGIGKEFVKVIAQLILFITFILMMRTFVSCMMLFSELLRNVILGMHSAGQAPQMAADLERLSLVKGMMYDMEACNTMKIWDLLTIGPAALCQSVLTYICYVVTGAIIFTMVLLGDIMLGISVTIGPFIVAIGMIKGFEGWVSNLFKGIITFALYMPCAAIYMFSMAVIHAITPNLNFLTYLIISYSFFTAATKIPDLAENLSGTGMALLAAGGAGRLISKAKGIGLQAATKMMGKK